MIPNGYNTIPSVTLLQALAASSKIIRTVFYVDANAGDDTNDGLSWENSLKTLGAAIALSDTDIAADSGGWAARNQIYFKGDNNEAHKETIVTLPNKCDVIGVGSYNDRAYPIMFGAHLLADTSMGCHFYNMGFRSLDAGGAAFTTIAGQTGLEFHGCTWIGWGTTAATYALVALVNDYLVIDNCRFLGAYSVAAISIGAGVSQDLLIIDNHIESGAIGIKIGALTCASMRNPLIKGNSVFCKTLTVDDDSNICRLEDNKMVTEAAHTLSLILDYNKALSINNMITSATVTATYPELGSIATG